MPSREQPEVGEPKAVAALPAKPPAHSVTSQVLAELAAGLQARVSRLVGNRWFWIVSLSLVFLIPLAQALGKEVPKPPAMKLPLPAFQLVNERGERFGSEDLKGRVWVADFVFTSCPTVCPKLTKRMAEIQHRTRNMGDAIHLVTFSVDPENDTPDKLRAYAEAYRANPARWTFLTGPLDQVEPTVVKGFKIAMGKEESSPGSGLFGVFHGERLVLVDPEGNIRGYYEADDEGITEMLHAAGVIANVR